MEEFMQHQIRLRKVGSALALALGLGVNGATSAQAQSFTVLYAFTGGVDGAYPIAGLAQDKGGNLYGTAYAGGASGYGTVFKLNKTGKQSVLHSFTGGKDGGIPWANLVRDPAGNLYSTSSGGGTGGNGVVFKLDTTGKETVLHSFSGGRDGAAPRAGLILGPNGSLYGTALAGGASGAGVVFKFAKNGKERVLHSFTEPPDGAYPQAVLLTDSAGNFYGTTVTGGTAGAGTVFKLDKTGKESVLYNFTGGADGEFPAAGLIMDAVGNLYSTTSQGGALGYGAVFKLDTTGSETVLYSFTGGADGAYPYAGLVMDATGNFYGITIQGGTSGFGALFKLDTSGVETVLHNFTGGADGGFPYAGLIMDAVGNLYGDAQTGGTSGFGTVFELTP